MYSNEALYTTLTWAQLVIGLIIGLIPVAATMVIKWTLERRNRTEADVSRSPARTVGMLDWRVNPPSEVTTILRGAYYILRVLLASETPVFFCSILQAVHHAQRKSKDREMLSGRTVRTVLDRLLSHGNIQLSEDGFSIKDSGVKLYSRIVKIGDRQARRVKTAVPYSSSGVRIHGGVHTTSTTSAHAIRAKALTHA